MNGQREDNVARVRDFVVRIQQYGRMDLIDSYFHEAFCDRTPEAGQSPRRDGILEIMRSLHDAFADIEIEIVHCVGQGDVVATHKVLRGRHVGEWLGESPTGERVELRIMDFIRLRDGLLIEHWGAAHPLNRL